MKAAQYTLIAAVAGFAGLAATAQAHDLGPDKAVQLLEAGKIQSFEKLNKVVLDKHPNATLGDTELEDEYGKYIYQVELRDEQGVEWDIELNAATGDILREERDD